jgi:hypothetical protein
MYAWVNYTMPKKFHHPLVVDMVKEAFDICIHYIVHFSGFNDEIDHFKRIVAAPIGPETAGTVQKISLIYGV